MPLDYAIRCEHLSKHFGSLQAVCELDLSVRPGECFGLLGPNGAGKTTTIEILEGLSEPTHGQVFILGQAWGRHEQQLRQRIGITLQETRLPEKLTVYEMLVLFRSFYRQGRQVEEVIDLVSLGDKRQTRYEALSGGQKQRLAVACALVGDPELLFLDEPTTGLDPQSRRNLWEIIVRFRARGGTVLLTTHYMDEAERLCDRVGIVDHGKLISLGTPQQLIASLGGEQVVEFALDRPVPDEKALGRLAGVHSARTVADGYALTVEQIHVALPALLSWLSEQGVGLTRLTTHQATLEDVFVELTGRHLRD